jgi:hypothetical protein
MTTKEKRRNLQLVPGELVKVVPRNTGALGTACIYGSTSFFPIPFETPFVLLDTAHDTDVLTVTILFDSGNTETLSIRHSHPYASYALEAWEDVP